MSFYMQIYFSSRGKKKYNFYGGLLNSNGYKFGLNAENRMKNRKSGRNDILFLP